MLLPNETTFENLIISEVKNSDKTITNKEFIHCKFSHCDFLAVDFSFSMFEDCTFTNCNLSLVKFNASRLDKVQFYKSKTRGDGSNDAK